MALCNRQPHPQWIHVLRVVNEIGKLAASKTHLILITHHEDEITDCFANVFEIRDRQLVERDQAA